MTGKIFKMLLLLQIGINAIERTPVDLKEHYGDECLRHCTQETVPRICYYNWTIEHYTAMGSACQNCYTGVKEDCFHTQCITVDGFERGVMSINRMIPGPAIQVCKGDTIVVDVINEAQGSAVTMHWHGLHHKDTPFMDGVPYVTQCPILYGTTFRYKFTAAQAGTFFYHSHSGFHKANGQYGALVVRETHMNDPNARYYEADLSNHVLLASDWLPAYAENFMPGQPATFISIRSLLINGRGRQNNTFTPLASFRVQSGKKYRFRFINSASMQCPFQLQIEKHPMQIIATDSYPVRPFSVDSLVSLSGERFDFVIDANQASGQYWIRLRAINFCDHLGIETFAVLSYATPESRNDTELAFPGRPFPPFRETYEMRVTFNGPDMKCRSRGFIDCYGMPDLVAYPYTDGNDALLSAPVDYWLELKLNIHRLDDDEVFGTQKNHFKFININKGVNIVGTINDISYRSNSFPLLTQSQQIDENIFCNTSALPKSCQTIDHCFCLQRLKVKLDSVVVMRITDQSPGGKSIHHPFHLHGHQFMVVDMGQQPYNTSGLNNEYPPYKDTVTIPGQGFVVVKFRANNPGFWFIHCHFELHLGIGMGMVLQVGEIDEMVQPPVGFPRCNNYQPHIN